MKLTPEKVTVIRRHFTETIPQALMTKAQQDELLADLQALCDLALQALQAPADGGAIDMKRVFGYLEQAQRDLEKFIVPKLLGTQPHGRMASNTEYNVRQALAVLATPAKPSGGEGLLELRTAALAQYGQHHPTCKLMMQTGKCSCGYSAALGHTDLDAATKWRWAKPDPSADALRSALERASKIAHCMESMHFENGDVMSPLAQLSVASALAAELEAALASGKEGV